jgi:hypothetical protein
MVDVVSIGLVSDGERPVLESSAGSGRAGRDS